jgi:hypothetical protein
MVLGPRKLLTAINLECLVAIVSLRRCVWGVGLLSSMFFGYVGGVGLLMSVVCYLLFVLPEGPNFSALFPFVCFNCSMRCGHCSS